MNLFNNIDHQFAFIVTDTDKINYDVTDLFEYGEMSYEARRTSKMLFLYQAMRVTTWPSSPMYLILRVVMVACSVCCSSWALQCWEGTMQLCRGNCSSWPSTPWRSLTC